MSETAPPSDTAPPTDATPTDALPAAAVAWGDASARRRRIGRALGAFGRAYLPHLVLAAFFVAARVVYRAKYGVMFDASPITYFIQYIPLWLIEHDFWRSIAYLCHQAPLQNVMAGGVWKLLGEKHAIPVLDAMYLGFGFVFASTMLANLRRLGVHVALATAAATLYTCLPVTVEFELWLFYHTPVIALMMIAVWAMLRFYERGTLRAGVFTFAMLAVVALFRNIYGAVWMLATVGIMLVRPPPRAAGGRAPRKIVLLAAAVPILIVAANAVRPAILVGPLATKTLVSANLGFKIWPYVPEQERKRLKAEGLVSDAVEIEPAFRLRNVPSLRVPHEPTGVPLLDMTETPDGAANHHTLEFILIADKFYKRDADYLFEHYPSAYVAAVKAALFGWYVASPTRDAVMGRSENVRKLKSLHRKLEDLGGVDAQSRVKALMILLPLAYAYGAYRVLRPRALVESERSLVVVLLFMLMTIAYVTVGMTMVSYGDFSRYRFEIDPFYYTLLTLLAQQVLAFVLSSLRRPLDALRARVRRREPIEASAALPSPG